MKTKNEIEKEIKLSNITSFIYLLLIAILGFTVVKAVTIGSWMMVMWLLSVVFIFAMLFKEHEKGKFLKSMV